MGALPTTTVIESTSGQVLRTGPWDPQLHRHAVLPLDGSDVLYQVLGFERRGDAVHAEVDVFDDPGIYEPFDRSDHLSPPTLHRVASTDGVELALHYLGGVGQRLLICHATGFHGLAYAPLAQPLTTNFEVWALDLRGHGSSTAPASGDFSWRGMADDVLAAARHLGPDPVLGVGHSLGGAALLLAEETRSRTVGGAYLWEPIVVPEQGLDGRNPMSGPARKRRATFASKAAARERYASRPPLSLLRSDALAAYVEHGFVEMSDGQVTLACAPENEARTFEAIDKPTLADAAKVDVPFAVVAGAEDPPGLPEQLAPQIAAAGPAAIYRRHEHLGHLGPLQDPTLVAADVLDFFRTSTNTAPA